MLSEELAVFDNLKGRLYLIVHADPREPQAWARAQRRLDELVTACARAGRAIRKRSTRRRWTKPTSSPASPARASSPRWKSRRNYIRAGDIFQVVLSQRLSVPFQARPVDVYRALRALNPSPYMYFLDVGGTQVVGSSPEILVRLQDGRSHRAPDRRHAPARRHARGRPALEAELLADPKERAEHLMLIDLGRNDVGRVAEPGTVRGRRAVRDRALQPRHAHRQRSHRQAEATGLSYADVLRATFPAGTVSGAPKIRALEVIRELEPITPQRLLRRGRLHRLARRCRHRHRHPHRRDPGRPPARAGRRRHRPRLRSAEGMGGDDEQGPRAVPRRGRGRAGALIVAVRVRPRWPASTAVRSRNRRMACRPIGAKLIVAFDASPADRSSLNVLFTRGAVHCLRVHGRSIRCQSA